MSDTILTADDAKRLLVCMQLGILIQSVDGHRYIAADGIDYPDGGWDAYGVTEIAPLNLQLKEAGHEPIRGKQYGMLRDCFNVIDAALRALGQPTLLEQYATGGDDRRSGDAVWGFDV